MSGDLAKKGSFEVDIRSLYKFVKGINRITSEIRLHITEGKISATAVDMANVALIVSEITSIKAGEGLNGKKAILGLDVSNMSNMLERLIKELTFDESAIVKVSWHPGKEHIIIDVESKDRSFHIRDETFDEYTLRKDPTFPVIKLPAEFSCDGNKLISAINICSLISDYCRIEIDEKGKCNIAAKADGLRQCRILLSEKGSELAQSYFSLDYLKDISKTFANAKPTIAFAKNHPIKISGEIGPGVSITYFLAPRIDEDEMIKGWI